MEGALVSEEPQTLFYNPAQLTTTRSGLQAELGLAKFSYSYEHPQFDPVHIAVVSPVASVGWKTSMVDAPLHYGIALFPTASTGLKINGLPRRVDGELESLNVNTRRNQAHLGLGLAWDLLQHPDDFRTTLGVALITTYDQRQLAAASVVDGLEYIDMESRGVFFRPELGFVQSFLNFKIGLSYMAGLKKPYRGKTTLITDSGQSRNTEQVDYDPSVLATSIGWKWDQLTLLLNVNRLGGQNGQSAIRDGINRKAITADVRDVNHLGAKVTWQFKESDQLSLAYAYLPTTWGAGSYSKNEEGFSQHELGNAFGNFNAITVRNQALSWRHSVEGYTLHSVLLRSAGSQSVDTGGDNPGFYQIEVISIATSLMYSF